MPDDSELSDQQERVRRLLAQARVDEPMPDDVVERLDRVLARLADEEHEPPATVSELATRRRRKAATLLVAAAAVVAVGVGAGNLLPGSVIGGDDDSGAASDAQFPAGTPPQEDELADVPSEAGSESQFNGSVNGVGKAQYRIRPDHFADDVARINDARNADSTGSTAEQDPLDGVELGADLSRSAFICDPAPWGVGRLVGVRYAGTPAVLAFRPPAGESQVVDLLECGTAEILRSVTLPAH
ncbi:hypothetical protein [Nocardioides sp.]|uniref:hypothetical protein n=1 Tax=Nocardioides sp. TaxID=35761 RepID=UPI002735A70B|nr:hypothetical protein [Nocardioides sp.]MDP3894100.1 hypothetical protein [Nocardioides sp.]